MVKIISRGMNEGDRWVVPKNIIERIIHAGYDQMGYSGEDKTVEHVKNYFWFPRYIIYRKQNEYRT